MNVIALIIFLAALVGAYFLNKNTDKFLVKLEDSIDGKVPSVKFWMLLVGYLITLGIITATGVKATEGIPVVEFIVPILTFVGSGYFLFIKPINLHGKK